MTGATEDELESELEWWAKNDEEISGNELEDEQEEEDVLTAILDEEEEILDEYDELEVAVKTRFTIGVWLIGSWISTLLLVTSEVSDSKVRSRSNLTISDPILEMNWRFCDNSPSCSGVAGGSVLSYSVLQLRSRSVTLE